MRQVNINVFNTIGDSYCVRWEDGELLHNLITKTLQEKHQVKLSFQNIEMVGVAFLNHAIGQLYGNFSTEIIKSSLSVEHMLPIDMALLTRVVSNAKLFYNNFQNSLTSATTLL
jgi:hypothetical protein